MGALDARDEEHGGTGVLEQLRAVLQTAIQDSHLNVRSTALACQVCPRHSTSYTVHALHCICIWSSVDGVGLSEALLVPCCPVDGPLGYCCIPNQTITRLYFAVLVSGT